MDDLGASRYPSGVDDLPRHVDSHQSSAFAPAYELTFTRLAVQPEQITAMGRVHPGPRSGKRLHAPMASPATRKKAEAIRQEERNQLRMAAKEAIESHIPPGLLDSHKAIEENERRILRMRVVAFAD